MKATLKQNREFQRAYKKGQYKAGKFIVVYAVPNKLEHNRTGISGGRKFGNSVQRNHVKRLIRESYRSLSSRMKTGYDLVIMVRAARQTAPAQNRKFKAETVPEYRDIYGEMERSLKKLGLI